jgi:ribosomal protein S18 acetylase RimI-like enzyme
MTAPVLPREWDSTFFGVRIFEAHVQDDGVDALVANAARAGADCLYLFADTDDLCGIQESVRMGARLVDLRVELAGRIELEPDVGATRSATQADREPLRSQARQLAGESRFSRDPRIPQEKVRAMYEIWLDRCLDEGVVAVHAVGNGGFVGARKESDAAHIELVYVDAAARGQGLGRSLIAAAVRSLHTRDATVVTQTGNVAAQRLYQALGLRSRSASAVLHLWLDERRG